MAQTSRDVRNPCLDLSACTNCGQPVGNNRRLADLGSGDRISVSGHDLDRAAQAIDDLDGNGKMARVTGLEPATSGVTGRRSNQLSYTRLMR